MAPSPLRDRLEQTFEFDASDLEANRSGRFSIRQDERMRAARGAVRYALAAFALAMVATGYFLARSAAPEHVGTVLGVIAAVAVLGYFVSASSMAALGRRTVSVAEGLADADARGRLRLGGKTLSLGAPAQLDAFEPGAAYRVFYVEGPRAILLSAEPLDERVDEAPPSAPADPARDPIVVLASRARWIPLAIVVLSAQMVGAILLAPPAARLPVFLAVFAEGVAFAVLVTRWLGRRR